MKMWAIFILSFGLFFLSNQGEIQTNQKNFQIKKIHYLKFIRVNKRVYKDRSFVYVDDIAKEKL